jgi:hypothetical protein
VVLGCRCESEVRLVGERAGELPNKAQAQVGRTKRGVRVESTEKERLASDFASAKKIAT